MLKQITFRGRHSFLNQIFYQIPLHFCLVHAFQSNIHVPFFTSQRNQRELWTTKSQPCIALTRRILRPTVFIKKMSDAPPVSKDPASVIQKQVSIGFVLIEKISFLYRLKSTGVVLIERNIRPARTVQCSRSHQLC